MIRIIFKTLLFLNFLADLRAIEMCKNKFLTSWLDSDKIQSKTLAPEDCSQIYFERNEKLNSYLGSLQLSADVEDERDFLLNISFSDIKWRKAHVKLSELNKPEHNICKVYFIGNQIKLPIKEAYDQCFNFYNYSESGSYVLDFKAELDTDIYYKQIIFKPPTFDSFDDSIPLPKRSIFISVDTSSNYEIILNIQTLPLFYNISYYKIEVFREKDHKETLLDVRIIKTGNSNKVSFVYLTYNEDGYYFFKVGAVNDICAEDVCLKTVSSKIYIKRKYPPLVIGIVGASFLIPFILFVFHCWTRRSQLPEEIETQKDKVFIVYNQTPEKHYNVVKSLEKSLKSLTETQIVNSITEATHVIYVCGTHIFELDPATHKFLVVEANKSIPDIEIYVLSFTYSTKQIPPYLKPYPKFNLMEDFGKFIHFFNCEAEYDSNIHYQELMEQVRAAQSQTEPKKVILNMPIIIVTEQSDTSDAECKENDILLPN